MKTRTISGIVGALFMITVIFFNQSVPLVLNFIISLICVLSIYELFSITGLKKKLFIVVPTMIFSVMMPLFGLSMIWYIAWYLYTMFIVVLLILSKEDVSLLHNMFLIYSLSIAISLSLSSIVSLRNTKPEFGTFYIVIAFGLAWLTDVGAYFFGCFLGKHKLAPKLSPKKTIEGAIGGIFTCVVSLLIICLIFKFWLFNESVNISYINIIILGILGSSISIVGDLFFSLIKRSYNIKDFGNVIPGHGGILDRFDSVVFVSPFMYIFIMLFQIIK